MLVKFQRGQEPVGRRGSSVWIVADRAPNNSTLAQRAIVILLPLEATYTNTSCFLGWARFRRDSVCTALMPDSILSTYIVCSSGSS